MEKNIVIDDDSISRPSGEGGPINVLAVDDDKFVLEVIAAQIKNLGHNFQAVKNGQEALLLLQNNRQKIDVVIMDWAMPVMDGLTAIRHIKENPMLRDIPIIMLTGADKPEGIESGLEAGAFYYLTKPVKRAVLRSVLISAGRASRQSKMLASELRKHRDSFDLIENCKFRFRTLAEAENLAVFIANFFPDPRRVMPGLGELLVNAVEHGNMAIGYERKHVLLDAGEWRTELERLEKLPENAGKYATATISRKENGVYIVIEDQGSGFDWKKFMTIDPSRAGDHHGRGIAQARAVSFDRLAYNEKGNRAVAFVGKGKKLEW